MKRFLTVYQLELDKLSVFDESNYKDAPEDCSDRVWQFAPDKETAIKQHFQKMDEYEKNPDKDTY